MRISAIHLRYPTDDLVEFDAAEARWQQQQCGSNSRVQIRLLSCSQRWRGRHEVSDRLV